MFESPSPHSSSVSECLGLGWKERGEERSETDLGSVMNPLNVYKKSALAINAFIFSTVRT